MRTGLLHDQHWPDQAARDLGHRPGGRNERQHLRGSPDAQGKGFAPIPVAVNVQDDQLLTQIHPPDSSQGRKTHPISHGAGGAGKPRHRSQFRHPPPLISKGSGTQSHPCIHLRSREPRRIKPQRETLNGVSAILRLAQPARHQQRRIVRRKLITRVRVQTSSHLQTLPDGFPSSKD